MKTSAFFALLVSLLCLQCVENDPLDPVDPDTSKIESSIRDFAEANTAFAFDLFKTTVFESDSPGEDVLVSPLSVNTALLMALNGADEETHVAIAQTLYSDSYTEISLNTACADYRAYVENQSSSELKMANGVFWDDDRLDLNSDFSKRLTDHFGAELEGMSFEDAAAVQKINDWVSNKTQDRIPKILDKISAEEVAFLINALYFKGDWANPFPLDWTYDREFRYDNGQTADIPMMSHDAQLSHYIGQDMNAVDLMFEDSAFSMTFIQPGSPQMRIRDFVASFEPHQLESLYDSGLRTERILLFLPKFKTDFSINLTSVLKSLGMEIAFDPQRADLSRLGNAPEGNLFISRVEHKTFLTIDEKGAEGAAVTSVGIGATSLPPIIDFNRPFVVVLRDVRYNSIMFMGTIENPEL